jgi:NADH dehydrogenase [ubiquinone] 1 alpha subcomplex assembly factor 5
MFFMAIIVVETRDISNLMGRAGFSLLTVDVDEVKVAYPDMWALMDDLRAMGEGNAILGPRRALRRDTLAAASAIYAGEFGALSSIFCNTEHGIALHGNEDGSVPATFQIIYMVSYLFVSDGREYNRQPL